MAGVDSASKQHSRSLSLAAVPESHPTLSLSPELPADEVSSVSPKTRVWMDDESVKQESTDVPMTFDDSDVLTTAGVGGLDDSDSLFSGSVGHSSDLLWNADAILSSAGSTASQASSEEGRLESKKTIRTDYLDAMRQFGIEVSSTGGVSSWLESGTDDADTDSVSTMEDDSRSTVSGTSTTSALSMATIGPEDGSAFAERHRLRKRPPRMAPPPVPSADKVKTQSLSDLREEQRRHREARESQIRSSVTPKSTRLSTSASADSLTTISPSTSDSGSSDRSSNSLLTSIFRRKSLPGKLYSDFTSHARKAMDDSSVMRRRKSSASKSTSKGTGSAGRRGGLVLGSSLKRSKRGNSATKQYRSRMDTDEKYRGASSAGGTQGTALRRLSAAGIDVDTDDSSHSGAVPPPPQRPKSKSVHGSPKKKSDKQDSPPAHRSSIASTASAGKVETVALSKPARKLPKRAKSVAVLGTHGAAGATSADTSASDTSTDASSLSPKMMRGRRRSSPVITNSETMVMIRNREKVHGRLKHCRSKGEAVQRLKMSVSKVDERVKCLLQEFVKLKNERSEYAELSEMEGRKWDKTGNFELQSMCQSYFQHVGLLYGSRIQLCKMHLQCFADKRKQLNNMLTRITDNFESYTLDDVLESVEAALMSASNVRLSDDSIDVKKEKDMLESLVFELKGKYNRLKMDTIRPMTAEDRSRLVITLLTQVKDGDSAHLRSIWDGLPYFHSTEMGNQAPFEQVLLDPRFGEFAKIYEWRNQCLLKLKSFRKPYEKWRRNGKKKWLLSMVEQRMRKEGTPRKGSDEEDTSSMTAREKRLSEQEKSKRDRWMLAKPKCPVSVPKVSRFMKEVTDCILDSSLSTEHGSALEKDAFFDAAYLMICRCLFPRIRSDILTLIFEFDDWMVVEGSRFNRQCSWMRFLSAEQIGVESSLRVSEDGERDLWTDAVSGFAATKQSSTPHDFIVGLIAATHTLQSVCRDLDPSLAMLSSDTLFPCIVYCVLRAGLSREWLCMLRMTEQFFHKDVLNFGQSGFCFSLVKAAVIYVLDAQQSEFTVSLS